LIANRGEIALRVIRTCREMGIKTVAVYSTADKESLHVKFADEAVCIGKPASSDSYLNIAHIMAAAEITNADAIHPGYGFLAENAKFSQICFDHDIKFIGPSADMINKMGDKISAKETMIRAGVPVVPGGEGLLESLGEAKGLAKEISYPVILKQLQVVVGKVCAWSMKKANWKKRILLHAWRQVHHLKMMGFIWKSLLKSPDT
jgi:acetyl-CoA carboxylase biotin carboxylase subunit